MNQSYEEEISLMELLGMLYKKRKQVIVTFLIVTLLASIYAFVPAFEKEKEYDAVSSMSIIYKYKTPPNPEEIGEGYVFYQDRMQNVMIPTIKGYAQSLTILRNIISELDIRDNEGELIKARKLAEDIEIVNVEGSNLITITVKYKDEKLAADIANMIPTKLMTMAKSNLDLKDYDIIIVDKAIASELEGSGKLLTIAIGMVLGLMMGIFLAFATSYMSKKVQSASQISAIGIDLDLIIKEPVDSDKLNKILALAEFSDSKSVLIGVEDIDKTPISKDLVLWAKAKNIDFQILSYTSNEFIIKAKEVDRTFIIIQENITEIKPLKELSKLLTKYNKDFSGIFIEN
ncbi:hypothetical protein [Acetoanaerobium noterae]|uniref:YveK family protein n=1 Tax=Acetoanaerobium noterae TaxID=745369 RepID=UPI0028B081C8|nr:hypothetical protein [Acetoanaerobium noterae]